MKLSKKIILGSGSPRRQALLEQMGITFTLRVMETDEIFPKELAREEIPEFLAKNKAEVQKPLLREDELLITADTIVWFNNRVYNKPTDVAEAVSMLSDLSGQTHEVYTAVALTSAAAQWTVCDRTEVTFRKMSIQEIHYYIQNHHPLDKAGSYGAQDWLGLTVITGLKGSYFTVMGLPTHLLYQLLTPYIIL